MVPMSKVKLGRRECGGESVVVFRELDFAVVPAVGFGPRTLAASATIRANDGVNASNVESVGFIAVVRIIVKPM